MPRKTKQKRSLDFLVQSFKHPRQLGTPFQSSKFLVDAVVQELVGEIIVELGAGTGPVTKGILDYLPHQGRLISFEINPVLFKHLRQIRDPRLSTINESAEHFINYVDEFDCVVSGLPLSSMPKDIVHRILEASTQARRFIQYKYFPKGDLLKEYFQHVKSRVVLRNIPPLTLVYVCERPKSTTAYRL